MYHRLKKVHHVEIMGTEILYQQRLFKNGNFHDNFFSNTDRYVKKLGQLLSERINKLQFDLVIFGDLHFQPLDINIPFIHFSDMTFEQVNIHLRECDERNIESSTHLEILTLSSSSKIIYSSEWIKHKAIETYNINPNKIEVIEFGANIPKPIKYSIDIDTDVCRLVFIGRNWEKKGGDKVLQAYRLLKTEGFPCSLTIIGSTPKKELDDEENITVFPSLNKEKPEDLNTLCQILFKSHFLVLPTEFDAYGIVFCEASAYGVPSIAADVGGVSQPVREGKNGFLLPPDATAEDYAEKIKTVFGDRESYFRLRASSRKEYETRLNWDVWGERVNTIFEDVVKEWKSKRV